ncbi:hypothetical protein Tco_1468947 [Tanacetum coccineum]
MATCHHLSGATWHFHCSPTVGQPPVNRCRTTGQRWSTTAVNGGQRRRSTTVNGGGPPLTTAGPPVNWWAGSGIGPGRVRYWAGSGRVMGRVESGIGPGLDRVGSGRHVASPEWATCHNSENPHPRQAWGSNSRPLEERLYALPLCQA